MKTDHSDDTTLGPEGAGPPPSTPPLGELGKFELLAELGRGGMGVVYKARQKDLDRVVAVKMILASQFASNEQIERFHIEARACARLPHPHIVQVYESGEVHGQPYFAMEYVEGASLEARLRVGPLEPEEAATLLVPIARAVGHLHGHGLVHRDLKPGNVLLDSHGRPVLTDFGLAKVLAETESHLTHTGAILGTPSYMAPEQAEARKEIGPAADVYSLGAILYECLTGRPPFRAATPLDTIMMVLESEPTLPRTLRPGLPRALELICLKCLDKEPRRRYPNATALADDLKRYLDGEATEAQPERPWQRAVRWCRREVALASHLGALGLGLLLHEVGYRLRPAMPESAHLAIVVLILSWAGLSVLWQRLLRREGREGFALMAWSATDVVLLTAVLALADGFDSPIVVLYPLYIAGSGLWWQVRLVWLSTALSAAGYIALMIHAHLEGKAIVHPHRHMLLLMALLILGYAIAYQVQRVRLLSRHFEQRAGPG